jgi:hypothetical protein
VPATINGCLAATVDTDQIGRWWHANPDLNIGLAMGATAGIFAVDIDVEGDSQIRQIEYSYGEIPKTVEVTTHRGRHLFYKHPGWPVRNMKLMKSIDIKGDHGYTVAPPSLHPSGARYKWTPGSASAFAAAPVWLLNRLRTCGEKTAAVGTAIKKLTGTTIAEGDRNSTIARLAGYLYGHDVNSTVVLDLLTSWNTTNCSPPLSAEEVAAVVASIGRCELR